jgi:hypothetical protein
MSRPDFSRIWGSDNAPFTPIEASDYAAGWVFRTGAPPRRVNFDYFQNLSDQRTAWLGSQMLLAVGHEWQDDVTYDEYAVVRSPVNGQLYRSLIGSNLGNEPSVSGAQWALGVTDSADTLNAPIATVAAAGTIDLTAGAPSTSQIVISGTGVNINGMTVAANRFFVAKMQGANTLVNSASLVTNTGANIQTLAGDSFLMRSTAANTVEIVGYWKAIDKFTSAPQIITTGGDLTIPHGLGYRPRSVTVDLLCLVADIGYSVDDYVYDADGTNTNANGMTGLTADDLNIYVKYGSAAMALPNKSSGSQASITPARWNAIFRADR